MGVAGFLAVFFFSCSAINASRSETRAGCRGTIGLRGLIVFAGVLVTIAIGLFGGNGGFNAGRVVVLTDRNGSDDFASAYRGRADLSVMADEETVLAFVVVGTGGRCRTFVVAGRTGVVGTY